jgi:sugar phosphate isomerase/epimerase
MNLRESPFPRLGIFFMSGDSGASHTTFLQRAEALGLSSAQVGDPFLSDLLANPAKRAGFVRDFQEAGIGIAGLAAYRNLVAPDPVKRRANLDHIKRALELAPELGTFAVATETGTLHPSSNWDPSPENKSPRAWATLLESVGELLETAKACGSILAIEGYVNNIVGRLDQVDALLAAFPTRHLGLMLDPYNYISRDLLPVADLICRELLERHADRFVIAHLKDVAALGADGTSGENAGRTDLVGTPEFCTGVFPQQGYMRFLRDRRPDLPIMFEHLPDEHLPDAIQRFHALTGRAVWR